MENSTATKLSEARLSEVSYLKEETPVTQKPSLIWTSVPLGLMMVVGVVIRCLHLNDPVGWDEATVSSWLTKYSYTEILGYYENIGNHLFFSLLAKVCVDLFGVHLWSLRLPTLLSGCLLIPAVYFLFSRISDKTTGLFAAALVSGSSLLILTSVNARGYILQAFLVPVWILAAYHLSKRFSWGAFVSFVLSAWFACYTLPTSVLLVPGIALWMVFVGLYDEGKKGFWRSTKNMFLGNISAGVLIGLSYLWPLLYTGMETITARSYFEQKTMGQMWAFLFRVPHLVQNSFHWDLPPALFHSFPYIAALGLLGFLLFHRKTFVLYLLLSASSVGVILLMRLTLLERILVFYQPLYLGAVAEGLFVLLWAPQKLFPGFRKFVPALSILVCLGMSYFAVTGEMVERAPGYARTWGVRKMVDEFDQKLLPSQYWANLYPQWWFWIGEKENFRERWRSYRPQFFVNNEGQSFLLIVRNHRETMENVLGNQKLRGLRGIDMALFHDPELIWEFQDVSVYEFKRRDVEFTQSEDA